MKRFVVDASVVLAWFLDRPVPDYAQRIAEILRAGGQAVVPPLWHLEVANGLVVAERRRLIARNDVDQSLIYLESLLALAIETSGYAVSLRQAMTAGRTFHLSAYDATYLETARYEKLPLATLDQPLRTAATRAHVELL